MVESSGESSSQSQKQMPKSERPKKVARRRFWLGVIVLVLLIALLGYGWLERQAIEASGEARVAEPSPSFPALSVPAVPDLSSRNAPKAASSAQDPAVQPPASAPPASPPDSSAPETMAPPPPATSAPKDEAESPPVAQVEITLPPAAEPTAEDSWRAELTDLQRIQTQQSAEIHALRQQLSAATQPAWFVNQAIFLVRAADNAAQAGINPSHSIALLTSATLAVKQGPVSPLRQEIEQQLAAAIQSLKTADTVTQTLSTLNALAGAVLQLPLNPALISKTAAPKQDSAQTATDWKGHLQQAWHKLKQVVVVRQVTESEKPVVDAASKMVLQQNLSFLLKRAEWALLFGYFEVYRQSLQQVLSSVDQYYAADEVAVQRFKTQLRTVLTKPVLTSSIDLTMLLKQLDQYRQSFTVDSITLDPSTTPLNADSGA